MIFRSLAQHDAHQLRHFRCAEKHDSGFAKRVNYLLKRRLFAAIHEQAQNMHAVVAANDDGSLAGIAVIGANDDELWEVLAVGVSVHQQHQGIGRALVQFAVADTPESWSAPVLFSVHEKNVSMRRLLREFKAERVSATDSEGYLLMAADPEVLTRTVDRAIARAAGEIPSHRTRDEVGL